MTRKSGIAAAVLAAFFLLSSAVPLRALDDEKCERQIHKAEANLQRAIQRHGEHSPQAERRRHELEEVRERCHHDRDHDHH
jgi:uncharacterized protein (DUF3084 family)